MKMFWFLLLLVFFSKTALIAQTNPFAIPRDYPNEVPGELRSPSFYKARSAVRNFKAGRTDCSFVVTSKSCHALTAAHCITDALTIGNHIKWIGQNESNTKKLGWLNKKPKEIQLQLEEFSILPAKSGSDTVIIDGKPGKFNEAETKRHLDWIRNTNPEIKGPLVHEVKSNSVQLFAMGQGVYQGGGLDDKAGYAQLLDDNEIENFYTHMRDTKTEIMADYAMIKLPGENCTCLRTGQLNENKFVVAIGYPGETLHKIADGGVPGTSRETAFSVGRRCEPSLQNTKAILAQQKPLYQFLHSVFGSHLINKRELLRKNINKIFKDQLIQHTGLTTGGLSGGALLNEEMRLIGINTMGDFDKNDPDFSSSALSIAYIQQELKGQLSEEDYSAAFDCPE